MIEHLELPLFPEPAREVAPKHISFSQISEAVDCGKKLEFHRARVQQDVVGINLLLGSAVHNGCEDFMIGACSAAEAGPVAGDYLLRGIQEVEDSGRIVGYDDVPREKLGGGFYQSDEANVPDANVAHIWAELLADRWASAYHNMTPLQDDEGYVVERAFSLPVKDGWTLDGRIDLITNENIVVDLKTAKYAWKENIKAKIFQAHVYFLAFEHLYGEPPAGFEFHVLVKDKAAPLQVVPVPYDRDAVRRTLEQVVMPTVRLVEAEAFIPNPDSPFCSAKWCGYWSRCDFGGARLGFPDVTMRA